MNTESRRNSKVEASFAGENLPQHDFKAEPPTRAQNIVLFFKILGGAAVLGFLLWVVDRSNT